MRFAVMILVALTASSTLALGQESSAGMIKGRVLDLFGNPIGGVEVSISVNGKLNQRLVTDQIGAYEARGLQAGDYLISATLRGFHVANRSVYLEPGGQAVVELGLRPGRLAPVETEAIIKGTTRQLDGTELGSGTITIINAFNDEIREQILAGPTGRFELRIAEAGQYVVYVSKPGFNVAATGITIPIKFPKEPLTVDFKLRPIK
jgi:Carboxypeptidase regulatory-like domain